MARSPLRFPDWAEQSKNPTETRTMERKPITTSGCDKPGAMLWLTLLLPSKKRDGQGNAADAAVNTENGGEPFVSSGHLN